MSDIVAKITIKVYLVSGREITHTYDVPTSEKELQEFFKDMVGRELALGRDSTNYLYFENPSIIYNTDNVEGVELSSVGVKELESFLRKAQASMGFLKQKSNKQE